MKKILFPVVIFITSLPLITTAQTLVPLGKENYIGQKWYNDLVTALNKENKIDSQDAIMIKSLSSNSHVAFEESTAHVVERFGKISEADIKHVYSLMKNDSAVYVFTQTYPYLHLFVYNKYRQQLKRVNNKGSIVLTGDEHLVVFSVDNQRIIFNTVHDNSSWKKYFQYEKTTGMLAHVKNCHMINEKETCEMIK